MEDYAEDEYSDDFEDESGIHEGFKTPTPVTEAHHMVSVTAEEPRSKVVVVGTKAKGLSKRKSKATRVSVIHKRKGLQCVLFYCDQFIPPYFSSQRENWSEQ